MLKRTPLFTAHQKLGARLVEFGGWEMPVQYSSIMEEHHAVRTAAGLFDISHMGEIFVSGPGAVEFLNHTLTNDVGKLTIGQGQYTLMCRENGGVIDDLYAYRVGPDRFLLIVNASRIEADEAWLTRQGDVAGFQRRVSVENASDRFGAVAVQGPRTAEFIDDCFGLPSGKAGALDSSVKRPTDLKKNEIHEFGFGGAPALVSRTGYTGEDGFEIIAPTKIIADIWITLLRHGHAAGVRPAGLGARDTLRLEACYPLYGHELDETTSPIEAGLSFFVSLDKGDFIGRATLAKQKSDGVSKKCVAFKMTDKTAPPRPHYPIWSTGAAAARIGGVVSGTQSPSLGVGIGMGYAPPQFTVPGTTITVEIRGKPAPAVVVRKPFYRSPSHSK